MPGIVVGVDGSAHALRALEWAMREAAIRHTELTVLLNERGDAQRRLGRHKALVTGVGTGRCRLVDVHLGDLVGQAHMGQHHVRPLSDRK